MTMLKLPYEPPTSLVSSHMIPHPPSPRRGTSQRPQVFLRGLDQPTVQVHSDHAPGREVTGSRDGHQSCEAGPVKLGKILGFILN